MIRSFVHLQIDEAPMSACNSTAGDEPLGAQRMGNTDDLSQSSDCPTAMRSGGMMDLVVDKPSEKSSFR
jgi:hypothetical protein